MINNKMLTNEYIKNKYYKKIIFILIITLIIISTVLFGIFIYTGFAIRYASKDDLILTISIEKETINISDGLDNKVIVYLENICDQKKKVFKDFSINQLLSYQIITPSNITIYPNISEVQHVESYIILSPSENLKTTVNIFDYKYRHHRTDDFNNISDYIWDETGLFKIQFSYLIMPSLETIISNVIEFWIKV